MLERVFFTEGFTQPGLPEPSKESTYYPMSARLCLASIGVVWAAEFLHPLLLCGTQHSFCLSQGASSFSHLLTKLYFGKDENSGYDENQQDQSWYHNGEQRESA